VQALGGREWEIIMSLGTGRNRESTGGRDLDKTKTITTER